MSALATSLEAAKPGEIVLLRPRGFGFYDRVDRLKKIDRCTAAMIFIGSTRFYKKSGREVGGSPYGAARIVTVTSEEAAKAVYAAKLADARRLCMDAKWATINPQTVLACAELLMAAKNEAIP